MNDKIEYLMINTRQKRECLMNEIQKYTLEMVEFEHSMSGDVKLNPERFNDDDFDTSFIKKAEEDLIWEILELINLYNITNEKKS